MDNSFKQEFSSWTSGITNTADIDWVNQLRILNEITDLISARNSVEEIIALIYKNVNRLIDAYQFCVGIYDEKKGLLHYRGMIEDGKLLPDFSVDAFDPGRLASWCIRHCKDIFINDFDNDYHNYLAEKPQPLFGIVPGAALYTPLILNEKVAGLIMVRTIHKNVYKPYHLYLLKTVGNFVVRAITTAENELYPIIKGKDIIKEWRWSNTEYLPVKSKNALLSLTDREREVLFLLIKGCPNKVIAGKLYISAGTVKTHTLHIYQKMDVANRTSAILKAVEWGWLI